MMGRCEEGCHILVRCRGGCEALQVGTVDEGKLSERGEVILDTTRIGGCFLATSTADGLHGKWRVLHDLLLTPSLLGRVEILSCAKLPGCYGG